MFTKTLVIESYRAVLCLTSSHQDVVVIRRESLDEVTRSILRSPELIVGCWPHLERAHASLRFDELELAQSLEAVAQVS